MMETVSAKNFPENFWPFSQTPSQIKRGRLMEHVSRTIPFCLSHFCISQSHVHLNPCNIKVDGKTYMLKFSQQGRGGAASEGGGFYYP